MNPKPSFAVLLLLATAVCEPPPAQASTKIVGNGGDVIYCPSAAGGSIAPKAELLDLYEARLLRGVEAVDEGTKAHREILERVSNEVGAEMPGVGSTWTLYINSFVREARFLRGQRLVDVPDSLHISVPIGCELRQIAIQVEPQRPGEPRYTIDGDLWDLLSESNKAALVLHEILYRLAIPEGATDSTGVRFLVAELMAARVANLTDRERFDLFFRAQQPRIEFTGDGWNVSLATARQEAGGIRRPVGLEFDRATGSVSRLYERSAETWLRLQVNLGDHRLSVVHTGKDLTVGFHHQLVRPSRLAGFLHFFEDAEGNLPILSGSGSLRFIQARVLGLNAVDDIKSFEMQGWSAKVKQGFAVNHWRSIAQWAAAPRRPTIREIIKDFPMFGELQVQYSSAADLAADLGTSEIGDSSGRLPGTYRPFAISYSVTKSWGSRSEIEAEVVVFPPQDPIDSVYRWTRSGQGIFEFSNGDRLSLILEGPARIRLVAARASGSVALPWGQWVFLDRAAAALNGGWSAIWNNQGELSSVAFLGTYVHRHLRFSPGAVLRCQAGTTECVYATLGLRAYSRGPSRPRYDYEVSAAPCEVVVGAPTGLARQINCDGDIFIEDRNGQIAEARSTGGRVTVNLDADEWPTPGGRQRSP